MNSDDRCQKPDREGGPIRFMMLRALPYGRASDTEHRPFEIMLLLHFSRRSLPIRTSRTEKIVG